MLSASNKKMPYLASSFPFPVRALTDKKPHIYVSKVKVLAPFCETFKIER
jgi:hypothetical protein